MLQLSFDIESENLEPTEEILGTPRLNPLSQAS